jgi:hypothetical protein
MKGENEGTRQMSMIMLRRLTVPATLRKERR